MTFWETYLRNPQSLLVRKALFQVHMWVGIGIGLYLLMMSVSGSVIVYRDELSRAFTRHPVIVASNGRRMTAAEMKQAAQQIYPQYHITEVFERKNPAQAAEITMELGHKRVEELFDPYTGRDLGNRVTRGFRLVMWLVDLHDNLLLERSSRWVNGMGALLFIMLPLTGFVIWWPGVRNWRRSLTVDPKAGSKRLIWTLHSVVGFWLYLFILLWGVSGAYLSFQNVFAAILNFVDPLDPSSNKIRAGEQVLFWLSQLHFGRFGGPYVKALWSVAGLAPAILFVTGATMWWNRVLRKQVREWGQETGDTISVDPVGVRK